MARRANTPVSPLLLAGAFLIVAIALAGGWLLYHQVSDPFRTVAQLDIASYLENANSLRGNVYKLNGSINSQLAWSPAAGRLFSVDVEGGANLLPVLIPAEFKQLNIQRGQRYFLKIEVGDKGVLRVQEIRKV